MFTFKRMLGVAPDIRCSVCCSTMDAKVSPPFTGRCGHTICGNCHNDHVVNARNPREWMPCPMQGCTHGASFEMQMSPNSVLLNIQDTLAEIERKTHVYIVDAVSKLRAHSISDLRRKIGEDREEISNLRREVGAKDDEMKGLRQRIEEQEGEIQMLGFRIDGMREYTSSLHTRLLAKEEDEIPVSGLGPPTSVEAVAGAVEDASSVGSNSANRSVNLDTDTDSNNEDPGPKITKLGGTRNERPKLRIRKVSLGGRTRDQTWTKRKSARTNASESETTGGEDSSTSEEEFV